MDTGFKFRMSGLSRNYNKIFTLWNSTKPK